MAGSLLRGGRSLRGAPSANVQQRYRSSSEHQPAQKGVGEAALLSEGLTYQMKNTSVMVSNSAVGVIILPAIWCFGNEQYNWYLLMFLLFPVILVGELVSLLLFKRWRLFCYF